MWRTTGDVKWRERGYAIFQAIEKHARTRYGYSTVYGIDGHVRQLDDMPRYIFIALFIFSGLIFFYFFCFYCTTVGF